MQIIGFIQLEFVANQLELLLLDDLLGKAESLT